MAPRSRCGEFGEEIDAEHLDADRDRGSASSGKILGEADVSGEGRAVRRGKPLGREEGDERIVFAPTRGRRREPAKPATVGDRRRSAQC